MIEILNWVLELGLLGLLLAIERRLARMETRMGLCEVCPITSHDLKKVKENDS